MPPSGFTRSQIDKLGKHLRVTDTPSEMVLVQLEAFRVAHEEPMQTVAERIRARLGVEVGTTRLKTTGTLIDKLRRERTRLSTMQDVAGIRIVDEMSLSDQRTMAETVVETFPGSELVDRLAKPSYGYRALHVVVPMGGCLVEVQIRTVLQDLWAQLSEKIGDRVGREIRYGGPPDSPAKAVSPATKKLMDMLQTISGRIAEVERRREDYDHGWVLLAEPPTVPADLSPEEDEQYKVMLTAREEAYAQLGRDEEGMRAALESLIRVVEED